MPVRPVLSETLLLRETTLVLLVMALVMVVSGLQPPVLTVLSTISLAQDPPVQPVRSEPSVLRETPLVLLAMSLAMVATGQLLLV